MRLPWHELWTQTKDIPQTERIALNIIRLLPFRLICPRCFSILLQEQSVLHIFYLSLLQTHLIETSVISILLIKSDVFSLLKVPLMSAVRLVEQEKMENMQSRGAPGEGLRISDVERWNSWGSKYLALCLSFENLSCVCVCLRFSVFISFSFLDIEL